MKLAQKMECLKASLALVAACSSSHQIRKRIWLVGGARWYQEFSHWVSGGGMECLHWMGGGWAKVRVQNR